MLPKRRSSSTEIELERKCETLSIRLLKVNAALRLKTIYCERLEFLVQERSETIDQLHGQLEQSRARIRKLDAECEHLADMLRIMPQLDPAMLAPK